jgi:hypothetical protein
MLVRKLDARNLRLDEKDDLNSEVFPASGFQFLVSIPVYINHKRKKL